MEISGSKSPRGLIESQIGWKKLICKPKTCFGACLSGLFFIIILAGFYPESGPGTPSMEISGSKSPRGLIESQIGWKNRISKPKNVFLAVVGCPVGSWGIL